MPGATRFLLHRRRFSFVIAECDICDAVKMTELFVSLIVSNHFVQAR